MCEGVFNDKKMFSSIGLVLYVHLGNPLEDRVSNLVLYAQSAIWACYIGATEIEKEKERLERHRESVCVCVFYNAEVCLMYFIQLLLILELIYSFFLFLYSFVLSFPLFFVTYFLFVFFIVF